MKLFTIAILLLVYSCDTKISETNALPLEITSQEGASLSKEDIDAIDYADYGLSPAAQKETKNWASYLELERLVQSIKSSDLSYFQGDKEVIKTFINDLKTTIPESVSSEANESRIIALETKFYKLESAVVLQTTSKEALLQAIKEFLISVSNFNLQMNKKFEKEAQDIAN